jgi:tRNA(Ile)-lysidine synthase
VAHVNYRQRKESNYDEELVKNYCQARNLPFSSYQVQLKKHSPKINFQAEARRIRYIFFQTVAKK